MALAEILPPRDLLEQVQGVESGLRRGNRARLLGVVVAAVQATILIANSQWLQDLLSGDWSSLLDQWPLFLSLFLFVLSVFAVSWGRFWLKESREPFRYTYSIAPFEPLAGSEEQPILVPLHADLRERLSERITRLSLQEDVAPEPENLNGAEGTAPAQAEAHIHITGTYAVRTRPPDPRWFVEVTPWVHVGGATQAARLATPVRYALEEDSGAPPAPSADEYEHILERTYFTLATAIYRQIEDDVDRKIKLLPSRWFRATALFHEAEDYARSNTLDAYEKARRLYQEAALLYDSTSKPLPSAPARRQLARLSRSGVNCRIRMRSWASRLVPGLGRSEVLTARAEIGYATALLDTGALASLTGLRSRAAFEAAPIARRAKDRLEKLGDDVPGRHESLFEALVCLAHAETYLGADETGADALARAESLDPQRAEDHARYLWAKASIEPRLETRISGIRSTVEHGERFEAARFDLACASEMLWRTRPTLERGVANTVRDQYSDVLKVNPSNIAAWANRGYVAWLMGEEADLAAARRCFDTGRRFKEIKHEAYVAELDHGLARVAAETGDFDTAYFHYIAAVSARIAKGWRQGAYHMYYYERISADMLARYKRYAAKVGESFRRPRDDQLTSTSRRVRASVYAFALSDYGEACFEYYLGAGDRIALDRGYAALKRAVELNPRFAVPWLTLATVERERQFLEGGTDEPGAYLDKAAKLEPGWPEVALVLLEWHGTRASQARAEAEKKREEANGDFAEAARLAPDPSADSYGADASEARFLRDRARRLTEEANRLEHEARNRESEARKLPRTLIPHDWLWEASHDDEDSFAWAAIYDSQAKDELFWERSLEVSHVRALVEWCEVLAKQPEPPPKLRDLVELIEERFLPNDFQLLTVQSELAKSREDESAEQDYRSLLERKVERELDANPRSFAGLTWLDETTDSAGERLDDLAQASGLSPFLYAWIGERLLNRARELDDEHARDVAVIALSKAKSARHPRTLLDVGDGFDELGLHYEALGCFRTAARHARDVQVISALAERLEKCGAHDRALELYQKARERDTGFEPLHSDEYYLAAIGALSWIDGDANAALDQLIRIPRSGGELGPWWRRALVTRLLSPGTMHPQGYTRLRSWLTTSQRSAILAGDETAAEDCGDALRELVASDVSGPLGGPLSPYEPEWATPFAVPIRLTADAAFYPDEGDDTPAAARRMIDEDIPKIREQILDETGVVVPGVRLGADPELPERRYWIEVLGTSVHTGTVDADVDDPYRYMLDKAAATLRPRLAAFVDMQALEVMLDREDAALVAEVLPGQAQRRAFLRFVKALIRDGVPVSDLSVPLRLCADVEVVSANLDALVKQVRRELWDRLPGRDAKRTELPAALEAEIGAAVVRTGGRLVDLELDELAHLRSEIAALGASSARGTLVTSEELRPAVRELAELDFPAWHVLDRQDLAGVPAVQT